MQIQNSLRCVCNVVNDNAEHDDDGVLSSAKCIFDSMLVMRFASVCRAKIEIIITEIKDGKSETFSFDSSIISFFLWRQYERMHR